MGIARLQEGIKWKCIKCENDIPTGEGISINRQPYCETCGLKFLERFEKLAAKIKKINIKT